MIVVGNGSSWYISGAPDNRWNNDDLHSLGSLTGSDFEAVDESSLQISANSGQVGSSPIATPTKAPTPTPTKNAVISLVPLPTDIPARVEKTTPKGALSQSRGSIFGGVNFSLFIILAILGVLLTLVVMYWGGVS
jgi:hypothetical protein